MVRSRAPICFSARSEELSLANGRNVGNNNDHTGVQRFLSMQNKTIRAIVRYKCVVLGTDCGHELPIFRTAEPKTIHVIRQVTCRVRYLDQRCVQAFIN